MIMQIIPRLEHLNWDSLKEQRWYSQLQKISLAVQFIIMVMTVCLILIVINKRKCKTISSSMWTVLCTIILGSLIMDVEVVLQYFTPTVPLCLMTSWLREIGFVICYGAIDLKLYRILKQFRTRKAHCWVIRDRDLLRYLSFAVTVTVIYLLAWTAVCLDFFCEGGKLLYQDAKTVACRPQWWNHITELAELMVLAVGFYYGYSARNAHVLFDERHYLYYAITTELTFSSIFYAIRALYPISLFQDIKFVVAIVRGMLTNNLALIIIFGPKVWYQKKVNDELRLSALNPEIVETLKPDVIDGEIRELNIAEMTPDEIREEFNRVYTQMGLLRDKTICKKNPHISKRKGGKKLPHRRFSLQKKGPRDNKVSIKIHRTTTELDTSEISETNELNEQCKSPEDSVVSSDENPQAGVDNGNSYNCQSATEISEIYEPVIVQHEHKYVIDHDHGEGTSSGFGLHETP